MFESSHDTRSRAEAAARRVETCRARRQALTARRPFAMSDVNDARAHLAEARRRALVAQLEASSRTVRQALGLREVPTSAGAAEERQRMVDRYAGDPLSAALREHIPLDTLYLHYFALGGQCTGLEVDARLHGMLDLPDQEERLLTHAAWELVEF